jgi:hypothetical protein
VFSKSFARTERRAIVRFLQKIINFWNWNNVRNLPDKSKCGESKNEVKQMSKHRQSQRQMKPYEKQQNFVLVVIFPIDITTHRLSVCDRSSEIHSIPVTRIFDVIELSTKNQSLVEHECVKIKCDKFFLYISAVHLAPNAGKHAYDLFGEEIVLITDNSNLCDVI